MSLPLRLLVTERLAGIVKFTLTILPRSLGALLLLNDYLQRNHDWTRYNASELYYRSSPKGKSLQEGRFIELSLIMAAFVQPGTRLRNLLPAQQPCLHERRKSCRNPAGSIEAENTPAVITGI